MTMKFKQVVERTPKLGGAWQAGLGALRSEDKPHIRAEDTRRFRGSVDIDSALQKYEPYANRWDFAIGFHHADRNVEYVYWVEIHTASDSEVNVVLKKLEWLKAWLKDDGKPLAKFECEFVWVSSGPTSFTLSSPQQKKFALLGLQHCGTILRIRSKRDHTT